MKIEIKTLAGKLLFEGDFSCIAEAVKAAVAASTNLYGANLYGADLRGANLGGANLCGANLCGANLYGANLGGANLAPQQLAELSIVPSEGSFVGWKKCDGDIIAKLLIPEDAKRQNATGRKCRAEYVQVLALYKGKKEVEGPAFTHAHGPRIEYAVGATVKPDSFNEDRFDECSHGIHFFITRIEAENYV